MSNSPSFRRNVGRALSGNSIYALAQFGILLAIARFETPTAVGIYALALAITSPAFLFASLKLRQVQVTDASGDNTFGEFLAQRLLTTSAVAPAILVCCAALGFRGDQFLVLVAVTALKSFDAVIDIQYGAMQRRERMDLVAAAQVTRGIAGLTAFAVTLYLSEDLFLATLVLAGVSVTQCATNFVSLHRLHVHISPVARSKVLLRLTMTALPLGLSISIGSLTTNVPRYFLGSLGPDVVGVFAALAYVFVTGGLIISSTAEAASPRLANLYAASEFGRFRSLHRRIVVGATSLGVVIFTTCILVGQPFLALVYGPEYAAESRTFTLLALGTIPQYGAVFIGTALNAMRKFKVQFPISMLGLAVVASTSLFLIPQLGTEGAALALVSGQCVTAIIYVIVYVRYVRPLLQD